MRRPLAPFAALALGALVLPPTAFAQVRPEVMLVVDTSTAMAASAPANTCGYVPNTRIAAAACSVRDVADGLGDAIVGLTTFPIACETTGAPYVSRGCGASTDCPDPGNARGPDGYPFAFAGCDDGGIVQVPLADRVRYDFRSWGDGVFGPSSDPDACVFASPFTAGATGGNELSVAAVSSAPFAGALRHVAQYLANDLAPAQPSPYVHFDGTTNHDPSAACRSLDVVVVVGGHESCTSNGMLGAAHNATNLGCLRVDLDGNGDTTGARESNTDLDADGDCYDVVNAQDEQRAFRVRTFAVGFGGACPDDDVEQLAIAGGTSVHPVACDGATRLLAGYYASDDTELTDAIRAIVTATMPVERCNGLDDDCDGLTDEGFGVGNPCTNGTGACAASGSLRCSAGADGVICNAVATSPGREDTTGACTNAIDDDCDGATDCAGGACAAMAVCAGACRPVAEVCNGLDDDCNGVIDDGVPPRTCGSDVGACRSGTDTCVSQIAPGTGQAIWRGCTATGPTAESCNGVDDDCDGATDDGVTQSCGSDTGRCRAGVYICTNGRFGTACTGGIGPVDEECNGLDDDCDGLTDEDIAASGSCGVDAPGACHHGVFACVAGRTLCQGVVIATDERCNAIDDDCDGLTDEQPVDVGAACGEVPATGLCRFGRTVCAGGVLACNGLVAPVPEQCNGLDDDCDGLTDEDTGGAACGSTVGTCRAGRQQCVNGVFVCAEAITAATEICNGLDDDCDGLTDEDDASVGTACGSDVGRCRRGTTVCRAGSLACDGAIAPVAEVCNGVDDDCNGRVDDGVAEGGSCGRSEGACRPGTVRCIDGRTACEGERAPRVEECNCLDDDCDGLTDEAPSTGALCGGGGVCTGAPACTCLRACGDGLAPCPLGRSCQIVAGRRVCSGDPCLGVTCDATRETCRGGACFLRCSGVVCRDGRVCNPATGACVTDDCRLLHDCAPREVCLAGRCAPDPCDGVACAPGEACYAGRCGPSCTRASCSSSEQCVHGTCVPDACAGVACAAGQVCDRSQSRCVANVCGEASCTTGQVCEPTTGRCLDDPCAVIRCAGDERCSVGECVLASGGTRPRPDRVTSGGARACSVRRVGGAHGGAVLAWCIAAALIAFTRRRRRREHRWAIGVVLGALGDGCEARPVCVQHCEMDGEFAPEAAVVPDAAVACVPGAIERCNGFDDDCDGATDEGFDLAHDTDNCGACGHRCRLARAVAACTGGVCTVAANGCDADAYDLDGDPANGCEYVCTRLPGASDDSTCDGRDDDCDGLTDEDVDLCHDTAHCGACDRPCAPLHAAGRCDPARLPPPDRCAAADTRCTIDRCAPGYVDLDHDGANGCEYACVPDGDERCDGRDNDCDGLTDDGDPGGGGACASSLGECRASVMRCREGRLVCEGTVPSAERCNGRDDDCNGLTDDGALVADDRIGALCGANDGACRPGRNVCANGVVVCAGGVSATVERCNGADDDCNGITDDTGPLGACGSNVGECRASVLQCVGGTVACVGARVPVAERCNGRDDDCNGLTDDGFDFAHDPFRCGNCRTNCTTLPFAAGRCTSGRCTLGGCLPGHVDLNHDAADGCEYACVVRAANEGCNGLDDDCDGLTDEDVAVPAGRCRSLGACAGAQARCAGANGFVCDYGAGVTLDVETGEPAAVESRCDRVDDNCDGRTDEGFALGRACSNGLRGACAATGTVVCDATGAGTRCLVPAAIGPRVEACNGIDDDCDGLTDETALAPGPSASFVATAWVQTTPGTWVMQYEASRPGATELSAGSASGRACAVPGVLPWTDLTYTDAASACAAAGARLCTESEWSQACRGPGGGCTWSYRTTCTTYQPLACNGIDDGSDGALAGGREAACVSMWENTSVFDLSGNVREFVTARSPGVNPLRGGGSLDLAEGTACTFDRTVVDDVYRFPAAGFRCCYSGSVPP